MQTHKPYYAPSIVVADAGCMQKLNIETAEMM
jgi:hypothetical protein